MLLNNAMAMEQGQLVMVCICKSLYCIPTPGRRKIYLTPDRLDLWCCTSCRRPSPPPTQQNAALRSANDTDACCVSCRNHHHQPSTITMARSGSARLPTTRYHYHQDAPTSTPPAVTTTITDKIRMAHSNAS